MPAKTGRSPELTKNFSIGPTANTGKLAMSATRVQPQLSVFSLTSSSSMSAIPTLRSTYLTDFDKTHKTLDFGVAGRTGNIENRAIEDAKKYRASILKSYDATARLLSGIRTPINANICNLHETIEVSFSVRVLT